MHLDLRRENGPLASRGSAASRSTGRRGRTPSPLLAQRLAPRHAAVQAWVEQPVGYSASRPDAGDRGAARPTPLLDFVLEAQRQPRRGAALLAAPCSTSGPASTRTPSAGASPAPSIPYDNTLRALRVSGAQLKDYLEWSARYFRVDPAGRIAINDSVPGYDYDLVRGARYDIDLRQPLGDRIRDLSVRGRPVQPTDSFTLALNSHRQTGAGGYGMLRGAPVVYDRNESIADLLDEEIRRARWRRRRRGAALAVADRARGGGVGGAAALRVAPAPVPLSPPRHRRPPRLRDRRPARGSAVRRAARLARAMDSLGAACACPTLRLDAGDAMQGASRLARARGEQCSRSRSAGFGAGTLGDTTSTGRWIRCGSGSASRNIPCVAANVFDSASGRRPEWLDALPGARGGGHAGRGDRLHYP